METHGRHQIIQMVVLDRLFHGVVPIDTALLAFPLRTPLDAPWAQPAPHNKGKRICLSSAITFMRP